MSADFLLIDNSNSFTKFALGTRKEVGPSRKLATRTLTPDAMGRKSAGMARWCFGFFRALEYQNPRGGERVSSEP